MVRDRNKQQVLPGEFCSCDEQMDENVLREMGLEQPGA